MVSFIVSVVYIPRFKTLHFELSSLRLSGKVCGNILALGVSSFITQIAITIVMVLFNNLLKQYGAESVYGSEIPITTMGIAMKVNQIMLSILVGIAVGAQPVIGYNYGSKNFTRVKKAFLIAIIAAEVVAVICFFVFRFAPMSVVSLFGSEEGLYNEFAVKCFRIFLMLCPLNGFQTVAAIFLQAIGKPVKSADLTSSISMTPKRRRREGFGHGFPAAPFVRPMRISSGLRSARSSRSLRKRARASLSADARIMSCGTRQTV